MSPLSAERTPRKEALPNQRRGALTQIVEHYKPEFTPEVIERRHRSVP